MRKQILSGLFALVAFNLVASTAMAQAPTTTAPPRWSFHGFAFGNYTDVEGTKPLTKLGHLWLIGSGAVVKDKLDLLVIVAPEGPPKLLHSFWFTWKKPIDGIDAVRFGRHIPNFSYEFPNYRIDKAPLIGYSPVVGDTSSARANGVEVESHIGTLQVVGGAFTGTRVGGDIPEHADGVDFYLRLRRPLGLGFTAGTSYRWADKDALGVDLIWKRGDLQFTGEYVQTETTSEWYVLGEQALTKRIRAVARFEHLKGDEDRWTVGPTLGFTDHLELKVNAVFSDEKPDRLLGQLTARW